MLLLHYKYDQTFLIKKNSEKKQNDRIYRMPKPFFNKKNAFTIIKLLLFYKEKNPIVLLIVVEQFKDCMWWLELLLFYY